MSWYKITLPLLTEIDPKVVEIGDLVREVYVKENMPKGFAMYHATRGSEGSLEDKMIVYLSPVAYEMCGGVVGERYPLEPCDVPARDEPDVAFVFGDPLTMGWLKEAFDPEPGTVEFARAEALQKRREEEQAAYEAFRAEQAAEAEAAAQGESAQSESAQA